MLKTTNNKNTNNKKKSLTKSVDKMTNKDTSKHKTKAALSKYYDKSQNTLDDSNSIQCAICKKRFPTNGKSASTVVVCDSCLKDLAFSYIENNFDLVSSVMSAAMEDFVTEQQEEAKHSIKKLPDPTEIKEFLDQHIIGHDETKKVLSVGVYNHYKRLMQNDSDDTKNVTSSEYSEVDIEKTNILLIGPTGCGKTLFAKTLAKLLDVPFAIADATSLTEAGYVGEDVENVLLQLIRNANNNVSLAERGIIYIDEIDKLATKKAGPSVTREVGSVGVQQCLLKMIEGTIANVPPKGGRKHPLEEYIQIDTSNILFILGGAFVGLEDNIKRNIENGDVSNSSISKIGFVRDTDNTVEIDDDIDRTKRLAINVQPEDLISYGFIPDFVGRIPMVSMMTELTEDQMIQVLTEPKNAIINQYKKLLDMDKVKLTFTDDALRRIAKEAIIRKTGARGLRSLLEKIMMDYMYNVKSLKKSKKLNITEDIVFDKLNLTKLSTTKKEAN
jgi:ATP-dependent Clp protease ATP-binding subunit ClpX